MAAIPANRCMYGPKLWIQQITFLYPWEDCAAVRRSSCLFSLDVRVTMRRTHVKLVLLDQLMPEDLLRWRTRPFPPHRQESSTSFGNRQPSAPGRITPVVSVMTGVCPAGATPTRAKILRLRGSSRQLLRASATAVLCVQTEPSPAGVRKSEGSCPHHRSRSFQ